MERIDASAQGGWAPKSERNVLPRPLNNVSVYLITFSTYGSHLPGQEGTTDRNHNIPGPRRCESQPKLRRSVETFMRQSLFEMSAPERTIVLDALLGISRHKQWQLLAAHVRSNHVHSVVEADATPEAVMQLFKSYASRALNLDNPCTQGRIRWARRGSARRLASTESVEAAIRYVLAKQGELMAWYSLPAR